LTRSIPIEKCLDDAMLVYSQNGERLRPQQGYPLWLFLPSFEGNMSVKWWTAVAASGPSVCRLVLEGTGGSNLRR
jgi:DMSO/TMAO reductase YedYZ molybdopterin-dependent catalytic subunit